MSKVKKTTTQTTIEWFTRSSHAHFTHVQGGFWVSSSSKLIMSAPPTSVAQQMSMTKGALSSLDAQKLSVQQ
jgi:hypothetical protein